MNTFGCEISEEIKQYVKEKEIDFKKEINKEKIAIYPKIKPSKVINYIEKELPKLDLLWSEENKESENDFDAYEEARYLEGHIQALFDFLEYFGYNSNEFIDLIPNLNKFTLDSYKGRKVNDE